MSGVDRLNDTADSVRPTIATRKPSLLDDQSPEEAREGRRARRIACCPHAHFCRVVPPSPAHTLSCIHGASQDLQRGVLAEQAIVFLRTSRPPGQQTAQPALR